MTRRPARIAALAVAAAFLPAPAADAAPSYVVYEIVRTKRTAPPVKVRVDWQTGTRSAFAWAVVSRSGGGPYLSQMGIGELRTVPYVTTYGPAGGCDVAELCTRAETAKQSFVLGFGSSPGRYVVGMDPRDMRLTLLGKGWAVRKTTLRLTVLTSTHGSGATGAQADGEGVEVFTGATAKGGRYGSAAFGAVPCDQNVGAGSMQLDAPDAEEARSISCQGASNGLTTAPVATTWTLDGEAVGKTYERSIRLLVLDFPKV